MHSVALKENHHEILALQLMWLWKSFLNYLTIKKTIFLFALVTQSSICPSLCRSLTLTQCLLPSPVSGCQHSIPHQSPTSSVSQTVGIASPGPKELFLSFKQEWSMCCKSDKGSRGGIITIISNWAMNFRPLLLKQTSKLFHSTSPKQRASGLNFLYYPNRHNNRA